VYAKNCRNTSPSRMKRRGGGVHGGRLFSTGRGGRRFLVTEKLSSYKEGGGVPLRKRGPSRPILSCETKRRSAAHTPGAGKIMISSIA